MTLLPVATNGKRPRPVCDDVDFVASWRSALGEELHEVAEELFKLDLVVMVLVDLIEERLSLLLNFGLVAWLALRLVVGEEDRLELLG